MKTTLKKVFPRIILFGTLAVCIGFAGRFYYLHAMASNNTTLENIGVNGNSFTYKEVVYQDLGRGDELLDDFKSVPQQKVYLYDNGSKAHLIFDSSRRLVSYWSSESYQNKEDLVQTDQQKVQEKAVQIAENEDPAFQLIEAQSKPERGYFYFKKMIGEDAHDTMTIKLSADGTVLSFSIAYCDLKENFNGDELDAKFEQLFKEKALPEYQDFNGNFYQGYEIYEDEIFYQKIGRTVYASYTGTFFNGSADNEESICNDPFRYLVHD